MTARQKIELRRSEIRHRLAELADLEGEARTADIEAEQRSLLTELKDSEGRLQAAIAAEEADDRLRGGQGHQDGEHRERVELRSRARLGNYLLARLRGRMVDGAEAELQSAATLPNGEAIQGIPLELWDVPRVGGEEERAVTGTPGTVGVNLDMIRPAVFAPSIAPRLGIDMPRVGSGTYASATIDDSVTAAARAKGADAPATVATFAVSTATPKRVSARLELAIEDIAAVGADNFEAALRENTSLALSDELDNQAINGDGVAPNLAGIFQRLANPADPTAGVESFASFAEVQASGIDGLWASMLSHIVMVVNPETYRLAARTFQPSPDRSAGEYLSRVGGGFWTNKRMPAKTTHVAPGIIYRRGRTGIRTAVCPHWGEIGIDDVYTGSIKGERYFTVHVLLGDVILVQPDAYSQVAFRVSTD